jgi:hypothetical protein
MTEAGSTTLRVELNLMPDAEPIQGCARGADGVKHAFTGWLELVAVLDQARVSQPPRKPGRHEGEPR